MATSGEYYNLYSTYKSKYNTYGNNLRKLNAILNSMTGDLNDEISSVNTAIDNLIADLNKSVRYNTLFNNNKDYLTDQSSVYADGDMGTAIWEIQEEITRVSTKQAEAASNRDYYYQLYVQQKQAEEAAYLEYLRKLAEERMKK